MAPISGLRIVVGNVIGRVSRAGRSPPSSPMAVSTSKSAPGQKLRPAPVTTTARTSGSASAWARRSK